MKKKTWTVLAGVCALALMAGGCGVKDQTAANESKSETEVSTAETTAAESQETVESSQPSSEESSEAETAMTETAQAETTEAAKESSEALTTVAETETTTAAPETTNAPETQAAAAAEKSSEEIYNAVAGTVALKAPVIMSADYISNYYGIDVGSLESYSFEVSEDATSAETVIIMKTKDGVGKDAVTAALQTVIDSKKAEMENYLPEQFEIVNKSSVKTKGDYVYLVISDQADTISQKIEAEIQ